VDNEDLPITDYSQLAMEYGIQIYRPAPEIGLLGGVGFGRLHFPLSSAWRLPGNERDYKQRMNIEVYLFGLYSAISASIKNFEISVRN